MALQQSAALLPLGGRAVASFFGRSSSLLKQASFSSGDGSRFSGSFDGPAMQPHLFSQAFGTQREEEQVPTQQRTYGSLPQARLGLPGARSASLIGMAGSGMFATSRSKLATAAMPFAASQTMAMSSASQVQSGAVSSSLLTGLWRFWRSQAPFEKPHVPVDSRTLPSILAANDERPSIGTWATAFFITIITSNLLGLTPFFEAPTSGLGFATGLGVSVWATATTVGFWKLGHKFPGHFIPGGTPWPMAFIFVPLETISYTFRAVSLGVRLWVNMLAGHTLLHILTGMSLAMPFSLPFYTGIPVTFAIACLLSALVGLEYLVAVLQSGVFSILSTVYIGEFNHSHLATPVAKIIRKH